MLMKSLSSYDFYLKRKSKELRYISRDIYGYISVTILVTYRYWLILNIFMGNSLILVLCHYSVYYYFEFIFIFIYFILIKFLSNLIPLCAFVL